MNLQLILNQAAKDLEQQKFKSAKNKAKQILNHDPNSGHALYIYAIANAQLNNQTESLRTFKKLIQIAPNNSEIFYNYGMILDSFDMPIEAINAFKKAIHLNPKHMFAYVSIGNVYNQEKQYELAISSYKSALTLNSHNPGVQNNLCKAYFNNKNYTSCLQQIENLGLITPIDEQTLILKIQCFFNLGNYRLAIKYANNLISTYPLSIQGHYLSGLSSQKLSRYPVAINSYKNALEIEPNDINTLMNLSICHNYLAEYKKSNTIVSNMKLIHPNNSSVELFELKLMEMNNELSFNSELLTAAITKHLNNEELNLIYCKSLMSESKYDKAIPVLKILTKSLVQEIQEEATYKLADCFDKKQNHNQSWSTYQRANKLLSVNTTDTFNEKLKAIIPQIKKLKHIESVKSSTTKPPKVVFIVGVPRSGTTLIDNILSSQNKAIVLDETPLISDLAEELINKHSISNYIDAISKLSESEIIKYRKKYFNETQNYQRWDQDLLIIDKSPLNLVHTLLIHTIFPESPIIFAARHPYDVCISCFMQNFRANPELMHAFSSTDAISETYNNLMTIWSLINTKVTLNQFTLKYEKLVNQTEKHVKELVAFSSLNWNPRYLNFNQSNNKRAMIHNPSYNQVNKDIYQNKAYRHQNYLNHIKTFQNKTSQWVDILGYQ